MRRVMKLRVARQPRPGSACARANVTDTGASGQVSSELVRDRVLTGRDRAREDYKLGHGSNLPDPEHIGEDLDRESAAFLRRQSRSTRP